MNRLNRLSMRLALVLPLLLLTVPAPDSEARPGGGNTYRGSSSSRGSSGSSSSRGGSSWSSSSSSSSRGSSYSSSSSSGPRDSSGDVLIFLLVFVVVVLYAAKRISRFQEGATEDWSTSLPPPPPPPVDPGGKVRERLASLREVGPAGPNARPVPFDPDFSLVPFEDFLYALYARAHEARGSGELDTLSAYLAPDARLALGTLSETKQVHSVVVGALKYVSASPVLASSQLIRLTVRFEANYTEVAANGSERAYYVEEAWHLSRGTAVKSRPPAQARIFKCPNCGAPLEGMRDGTCSYCQQRVSTGAFDWLVERIVGVTRERRGPQLGGDTPEEGTSLPTRVQTHVQTHWSRLAAQDPGVNWESFEQRLQLIFAHLQVAWSNRQWEEVRPYVSDSLFQMQLYWMETYRRQGLRNITQDTRITGVELARVVSDKYYHALTVRVFATGLDFTVRDADGGVVGGSRSRERAYSEYWTLIRGRGATGTPGADKQCPSCGALLSLNMAGNCTHCDARVTSGEFDWVLSRIEQDESYQG